MKNILKNIGVLALIVGLIVSCAENFQDIDYTPKNNAAASSLDLSTSNDLDVDGVTVLESSFRVNFSSAADGVAYYAIYPGGSGSPDVEGIIRQNASNFGSGSAAITSGTTSTEVIGTGVNPGYSYDVYAVMTSVDGVAGPMKMASFTTPDTTAPVFVPNESSPFGPCPCADLVSPFLTSVTLNFSEPVFYQGGDVTFEGFFDGVQVVVGAANFVASTDGSTDLTFTTSDMWGVNDFMIGTFDAGNFIDNVGLEADALGGFDYYFLTRPLTFVENIELNLTGNYDFTLAQGVFSGGIPAAGEYVVSSNGDELTVINTLATALGEDNEHVLRVGDDDGSGIGFLFLVPNPQRSSPGFWASNGLPAMYWHAWYDYAVPSLAGFYDFNTGEFEYWLDLADEEGYTGGWYLGDFVYNFTPSVADRVSADRSSSSFEGGQYENLPEALRLEQELRNSSDNRFESIENHPEIIKLKQDMLDIRTNSGVSIHPSASDMEFTIE